MKVEHFAELSAAGVDTSSPVLEASGTETPSLAVLQSIKGLPRFWILTGSFFCFSLSLSLSLLLIENIS